MSAYLVERDHIAYLVSACTSRRLLGHHGSAFRWYHNGASFELMMLDDERASEVGLMLWQENAQSLAYRYPKEPAEVLEYKHTGRAWLDIDPVQVLKSIACYEYQACEHPEWEKSQAFAFCRALESAAIQALPGYDSADWGAPEAHGLKVAKP